MRNGPTPGDGRVAPERGRGVLSTFRSLGIHNYRLWFIGALISNIGTWMQRTAQDWLVYDILTPQNASALGIVMALQLGPQLVIAPWAGLIADTVDRRRLLAVTQVAMALSDLVVVPSQMSEDDFRGGIETWRQVEEAEEIGRAHV